jgi:hypothetical protein
VIHPVNPMNKIFFLFTGYPMIHPVNPMNKIFFLFTGYPMIHPVNPVIQPDQSESGQISDG